MQHVYFIDQYILQVDLYLFFAKNRKMSLYLQQKNEELCKIRESESMQKHPKYFILKLVEISEVLFSFCRFYNIKITPMNFYLNFITEEQSDRSTSQQPEIQKFCEISSKKTCQKRKKKIVNPYKWKSVQNTKYVKFLKNRLNLMKLPIAQRKKIKINVIMSNYVKTRNPQQCRSHHQKMMLKYGTIENIIAFYPQQYKKIVPKVNSHEIEAPQREHEEEMKNSTEDFKESKSEPFWYQYLDLFSCHQSQEFFQIDQEF